ncbi:MAG: hypothetical protein AAF993_20010 [Pseudomonadota bacterium]
MELFEYISVLTSIIVGLGIAHLLKGVARIVQHPGTHKQYWVHLVWVGSMFFNMIFFWWWEFALVQQETWLFQNYLFVVFYAVVLYLICAMLFPDNLDGYDGYKDYFLSRRIWFFGLYGTMCVIDVYDTMMKGVDHISNLGTAYVSLFATLLLVAIVGASTRRHGVHAAISLIALFYQLWWAFRYWGELA